VLSDFCLRILGGEYDFTIKEMCETAHVPSDLLESALLKRLALEPRNRTPQATE
jgi:hypothetical protein